MARPRTPAELLLLSLRSPASPPTALRSRILASASAGGRYGRYADRVARLFDLSLETARALLVRAEDPASFSAGPTPGATWLVVTAGPRHAGALAVIGRLEPGAGIPVHVHGGAETTLVLEGGLVEAGTGEEVWRGDELFKPEGTAHALQVIGNVPCLAAVLVPGGVTFEGGTKP